MKFAVLALVAAVQASTIADGADCAKKLDANKKPLARVKCTNDKFCCMACKPGKGALAKDKNTKQQEFCLDKTTKTKNIVYTAAVAEVKAQCMDTATGKTALEADCGTVDVCTKQSGKSAVCVKKPGSCRKDSDVKVAHAADGTTCLADCKDKSGSAVAGCKWVKAVAEVKEAKEDWACACITGATRLATGAALVATAYLMA